MSQINNLAREKKIQKMNRKKQNLKKKISDVIDEELKEEKEFSNAQSTTTSSSSSTKISRTEIKRGQMMLFEVQSLECALNLGFAMIMADEENIVFASNSERIFHMNARVHTVTSACKQEWEITLGYVGNEEGFTATRYFGKRKTITEVVLQSECELAKKFNFSNCRQRTKVIFIDPTIDYSDRIEECLSAGLSVVRIVVSSAAFDEQDNRFNAERNPKIDFGPVGIKVAAQAFDISTYRVSLMNKLSGSNLPLEHANFEAPVFSRNQY